MYEHYSGETRYQPSHNQPLYYENPSSTVMERKFSPAAFNKFTNNDNIYEDGFSINTRLRNGLHLYDILE